MNKKEKKNRIMKLNEKIRMKLDAAASKGNFRIPRINYIQAIGMNETYRFRVSNIFNYRKPYKKRLLQIEQNIIRKIQELGYKNL